MQQVGNKTKNIRVKTSETGYKNSAGSNNLFNTTAIWTD
jgi:hypothetical protein